MSKVKISVIMAVFNSKTTVSDAIDSIISQTYSNWEFIICDDCSTDATYDILLSYQAKYPDKIFVFKNNKNSKLAYSLNQCLKKAQGKYVARMDADDISIPERLEKQLNFLENHLEYDVVGTSMIPFDENGFHKARHHHKEVPTKYDLLKNPCFNHATILMKKNVYDELGGYTVLPRTTRGQDYDLWFRFFAASYKGYNMQEALYQVREGVDDFRRRTLKTRLQGAQTAIIGYKLLRYPVKHYFYALKPILAGLIPRKIMYKYHLYKFNKSKKGRE